MRKLEELFNRSVFSHFLNSPAGRVFRLVAGSGFLVVGYSFRHRALGERLLVPNVAQHGRSSQGPFRRP